MFTSFSILSEYMYQIKYRIRARGLMKIGGCYI